MNGSVTPPSTTTVPPPPTSPFASPPIRLRCRRMRSPAPSIPSTSPATQTPPSELPTSSGLWRRRDHGRNAEAIRCRRYPRPSSNSARRQANPVLFARDLCNPVGSMGDRRTGQLHFRLPFCLRSACRAQNTPPFGRTLSFQTFASRLSGVDSSPEASSGPFPQISFTRLGSGSRRHTLRASMYRIQRTNLKKRS